MPGFSGLSNQSCERRFLPFGRGVAGSFPDAVLPFFFAISSSPGASFRRLWNRLISARECAEVRRERKGARCRSRWSALFHKERGKERELRKRHAENHCGL